MRLPPRAPPATMAEQPIAPAPPTRIIADVDLKLARVKTELEAKVPQRLAEERGQGLGVAGHLNYVADRGPFSIAVENDSLVVRTDVRAHAEACRGEQCYASCDPIARATAIVPLRLRPSFRFAPSKVTATFVKGCEVRALGGILKVDVTPTIQARLGPTLRRIEQQIDAQLPPVEPQAKRLWSELEKPRMLPLGGCIIVDPRGIVQGPVTGSGEGARVRFALLAAPEIRTRCGTPPVAKPLPPLAQDPALPAEDDIALGLVGPLETTTTALRNIEPFDAGGARARVADASGLVVDLAGEACGEIDVRSPLAWQGESLVLSAPAIANEDRVTAASLDPRRISTALATGRLPPPLPISRLKDLLQELGSMLSDPTVEVTVKIASVTPLDATVRADDVVARVRIRGGVALREK